MFILDAQALRPGREYHRETSDTWIQHWWAIRLSLSKYIYKSGPIQSIFCFKINLIKMNPVVDTRYFIFGSYGRIYTQKWMKAQQQCIKYWIKTKNENPDMAWFNFYKAHKWLGKFKVHKSTYVLHISLQAQR